MSVFNGGPTLFAPVPLNDVDELGNVMDAFEFTNPLQKGCPYFKNFLLRDLSPRLDYTRGRLSGVSL